MALNVLQAYRNAQQVAYIPILLYRGQQAIAPTIVTIII